jgi:integrase/recombinase XerD
VELETAIKIYGNYIRTAVAPQTAELYTSEMKVIQRFMGNVEVEKITQDDLNKLMGYLKNEYHPKKLYGPSDKTMKACSLAVYLRTIHSFFKWAEMDLKLERPDEKLVRPKYELEEVSAFTSDELKRITYAAEWSKEAHRKNGKPFRMHRPSGLRDLALIKVMLDTGLRRGEISRILLEDVDLDTGVITVKSFNSGRKSKPRLAYLGNSTKKTLMLFVAKSSLKQTDRLFNMSPKRIYTVIWDIGKNAGVENCHPHRFRHTFAIMFLRANRDPYSLQKLLGHSTMDMTRHYLDIADDDLRRAHGVASPVDGLRL